MSAHPVHRAWPSGPRTVLGGSAGEALGFWPFLGMTLMKQAPYNSRVPKKANLGASRNIPFLILSRSFCS